MNIFEYEHIRICIYLLHSGVGEVNTVSDTLKVQQHLLLNQFLYDYT